MTSLATPPHNEQLTWIVQEKSASSRWRMLLICQLVKTLILSQEVTLPQDNKQDTIQHLWPFVVEIQEHANFRRFVSKLRSYCSWGYEGVAGC